MTREEAKTWISIPKEKLKIIAPHIYKNFDVAAAYANGAEVELMDKKTIVNGVFIQVLLFLLFLNTESKRLMISRLNPGNQNLAKPIISSTILDRLVVSGTVSAKPIMIVLSLVTSTEHLFRLQVLPMLFVKHFFNSKTMS